MKAAAFYDVDGTLVSTNVVHVYAYYARNVPTLTGKLKRSVGLAASLPFYAFADKRGRKFFNDMFYKNYADITADRLHVLGEELFEKIVQKRIFRDMVELMKRSRAEGYAQVLVTGAISQMVRPMAKYLEVDAWFANELEIVDGRATGRLVPPVLAGPEKAAFVRRYAIEQGYDLNLCRAYADSASDIPMLCTVGRPVAVNPDSNLRATATAHDWPIIQAS
ncbi:MAG: HAD family phosphatase [Myxococcales bacterium]|jgi:HAD superfamily hydrolase (TIGR01490 family)|nr:HAD family phosphatase [Myxococcales bacterium]MCB9535250.1 HAD family phosphatase [Myxococcales bacterium]